VSQSKRHIQDLLARAGLSPRHRLGQNFMIDQNLVRLVADAGRVAAGDLVIEVGPGTGTLTEELLSRGARVVAVEIDRDLAALLKEQFADHERFSLIHGDALAGKHALNPQLLSAAHRGRPKLVANLPYNIASPLVVELLIAGVELLAFTVQKEVADRLAAGPATDAYGPLGVMVQSLARVEVLRTLGPEAFWPRPKIESALVRLTRDDSLGAEARAVGAMVARLFSARRKMLRSALARIADAATPALAALEAMGIRPDSRAEELSPAQIVKLFRSIHPAV
jgi:16S rRNA (adenine1518-N6/adenine1519-N6)-dimethyltransferase